MKTNVFTIFVFLFATILLSACQAAPITYESHNYANEEPEATEIADEESTSIETNRERINRPSIQLSGQNRNSNSDSEPLEISMVVPKRPSEPLQTIDVLENVTMSISAIDEEQHIMTVTIHNDTMFSLMTGEMYWIESFDGENWWRLAGNSAFHLIGYSIGPSSSRDFEKHLEWRFGTLEPGLYRVRKGVDRGSSRQQHEMTAEFNWGNNP